MLTQMCGETPVVFHKSGKPVQLIARNTRFLADPGTPVQRAVSRSFSDSIVASAALESLPHLDRGYGTVFVMTPPSAPGGTWTESVQFSPNGHGGGGEYPGASMIFGPNGALYGTTYEGAHSGNGMVFEWKP